MLSYGNSSHPKDEGSVFLWNLSISMKLHDITSLKMVFFSHQCANFKLNMSENTLIYVWEITFPPWHNSSTLDPRLAFTLLQNPFVCQTILNSQYLVRNHKPNLSANKHILELCHLFMATVNSVPHTHKTVTWPGTNWNVFHKLPYCTHTIPINQLTVNVVAGCRCTCSSSDEVSDSESEPVAKKRLLLMFLHQLTNTTWKYGYICKKPTRVTNLSYSMEINFPNHYIKRKHIIYYLTTSKKSLNYNHV
jgi:hypothetical protein